MKRFEMTEDLLTGVEDIDSHHRRLLELGNKVIDPSAIKTDGVIFKEALTFLSDYVIYHFAAEEYVMALADYPHYEHHRQWHERFRSEISNYANLVRADGITKDLMLKVSFAVENWLLEHIRITDRELGNFLKQQGNPAFVHLPSLRTLKDASKLPEDFDERLMS
jgi:hemerythrin